MGMSKLIEFNAKNVCCRKVQVEKHCNIKLSLGEANMLIWLANFLNPKLNDSDNIKSVNRILAF